MMKKITCLALILCLLAALSGCARNGGEEMAPVETLPPAAVSYEVPDGDRVVRRITRYTFRKRTDRSWPSAASTWMRRT